MKLNVKRTMLVGFGFMSICLFVQAFDLIMPIFLISFGIGSYAQIGTIKSVQNLLAMLIMPLFGFLSDRTDTRIGKRTPYIVCGAVLAAISFILAYVAFLHNSIVLFIITGAVAYLAVYAYRTPAVSYMPDVTPKRVRSSANAIINVAGAIGGVVVTVLLMIGFFNPITKVEQNGENISVIYGTDAWPMIIFVSAVMIVTALIFLLVIKEKKLLKDKEADLAACCEDEDCEYRGECECEDELNVVTAAPKKSKAKMLGLKKSQFLSQMLILVSVFLWYMAYSAVTAHFAKFSTEPISRGGLGLSSEFTLPLLIAQVGGFVCFLPSAIVGNKIGRRKTIMIGLVLMITAFVFATFNKSQIVWYVLFFLLGGGWATINVHSYIMSVEQAKKENTGSFTGLYYIFAMSAQALTPVLAGLINDALGVRSMFVYGAIFLALALTTMFFVRHGNAKTDSVAAVAVPEVEAGADEIK